MTDTGGRFTGRHFLMIVLGAFGVIICANLLLAYFALRSFPGLNVPNSYVASQDFDQRRHAQNTLGWHAKVTLIGNRLRLELTDASGAAVRPATLSVRIGAAATAQDDLWLSPRPVNGGFEAVLPEGEAQKALLNRIVFVEAVSATGVRFSQQRDLIHR